MEDRVELPRLYLSWHSPEMFANGDAELDIAADVLTHGKTSRLFKTLVYERRVATDVSAYQHSREMAGLFQISCTAAAGVTLTELHTAIIAAVNELAAQGPTDAELERGVAQTEAQFIYRLQTIGGSGGKSDQLNAYNTYVKDPGFFAVDRQRYLDVTSKATAAAVAKYLAHAPSVSLSVVPKGRRELALPGSVEVRVS
jgi:zinc protease